MKETFKKIKSITKQDTAECDDMSENSLQNVLIILSEANYEYTKNNVRLKEIRARLTGNNEEDGELEGKDCSEGLVKDILRAAYLYKGLNSIAYNTINEIYDTL